MQTVSAHTHTHSTQQSERPCSDACESGKFNCCAIYWPFIPALSLIARYKNLRWLSLFLCLISGPDALATMSCCSVRSFHSDEHHQIVGPARSECNENTIRRQTTASTRYSQKKVTKHKLPAEKTGRERERYGRENRKKGHLESATCFHCNRSAKYSLCLCISICIGICANSFALFASIIVAALSESRSQRRGHWAIYVRFVQLKFIYIFFVRGTVRGACLRHKKAGLNDRRGSKTVASEQRNGLEDPNWIRRFLPAEPRFSSGRPCNHNASKTRNSSTNFLWTFRVLLLSMMMHRVGHDSNAWDTSKARRRQ